MPAEILIFQRSDFLFGFLEVILAKDLLPAGYRLFDHFNIFAFGNSNQLNGLRRASALNGGSGDIFFYCLQILTGHGLLGFL